MLTGAQYKDSLSDGRTIYFEGEKEMPNGGVLRSYS